MTGAAGGSEPFSVGTDGVVLLDVYVQPGAARSEVVGRHGSALKVRVAAPPERGRANAAVEALLAGELGLHRRDVTVVTGVSGRTKRIRLDGVAPGEIGRWLRDGKFS